MAESTLARRLRVKLQLRDKKGRWIEMGGGGKWLSGDGVMKSGIVIGSKGNTAILREKSADGTLGTKDIHVNMKQLEMIASKASLDPATLKLVNSFKNNQSAKGIKEADAREQALTQAKADLKSGKAPVDEAEVEYEATVAEELEDLLLDAPVGTKLEGTDFLSLDKKKGKLAITKAANGSWTAGGYSNTFTAKEIATDGNFEDFRSTAADGKAINALFDEASKSTKKGIFKKKTTAPKNAYVGVPANNLDDIISATNSMLGKFNENQLKSQTAPTPQPATSEAPAANVPTPEAPAAAPTPEAAESDAPIDISDWKYHQGTQGGSNPGGIYTAPDGQDYYVKKSKSDMHAKNEVLADKFYEKLGVKTSQLKLADVGGGKLGTASAMVDGSKNDFLSKSKNDPEYLKKFQEDFAIDAWLANWDVVGLEYDNALTDANGDPTRIDPGGALLYRAMGSPKGDMFGAEVGEWESMRNGSNPASKTFGSMTDEQLKNSAAKLLNISEQDINDIVDSMDFDEETSGYLKETLASRRTNILAKFPDMGTKPPEASEDIPKAIKLTGMPATDKAEGEGSVPPPTPEAQKPAPHPIYGEPKVFAPKNADTDYNTLVADIRAKAMAGEVVDVTPLILEKHALNPDEAPSIEWDDPDAPEVPGFNGHFDGYNSDDAAALTNYVNDSDDMNWMTRGSSVGNDYIKNDPEGGSKIASDIAKMDNLISKSVVQEDTKVFRGVAMNSERLQKFLAAKMYSDLGFSSTSTDKDLADGWGFVNGDWQKNKTQVTIEMDLPAGFTAHRVMYSDDFETTSYHKEREVILPRGTDFDVTGVEEYTNSSGAKAYRLSVTPILNDRNYKPEGIKNGQSSEDTTATDLPGTVEDSGESAGSPENGDGGGQYADPDAGGSTGEEGSEPEAQGVEDPEVVPEDGTPSTDDSSDTEAETPEVATEADPEASVADEEEDIAPINGAKAMLMQMAKEQGISLAQLQSDLGLPADGAFPNKGKTVSNENGDVFEANAIVSNPKFGEGIASIILPSTNSVKVLYKDHGYKVTQAKNLGLVNGAAPAEVAAEAVDLSAAKPGDVGTNPANGKMYFVGKNNKALYIGDEVDYTKKGVTQSGKVSSIYKGAKTVKVDFEDGSSGVKKASQLVGTKSEGSDSSNDINTPNTEDAPTATSATNEAPEQGVDAPEEVAPEAAAEAAEPTILDGKTPMSALSPEEFDGLPTGTILEPNQYYSGSNLPFTKLDNGEWQRSDWKSSGYGSDNGKSVPAAFFEGEEEGLDVYPNTGNADSEPEDVNEDDELDADYGDEVITPEASEEVAPETPEEAEAPATPEASATASEEAPAAAEEVDKGWTPLDGYDPMGPSKIQIHPDMKTAVVYPHDHSMNQKTDYGLKGLVKVNPKEGNLFGVGHNGQPLYMGDTVDYLWKQEKFVGRIVGIVKATESAKVELEDGTIKLKKFSQLRGNHPKTVPVDENGNYTDWHGNPAQIPNFKGWNSTEDSSDNAEETPEAPEVVEETAPETPEEVATEAAPERVSVADFETGTVIPLSDTTSISKTGDGEWKMRINGLKIDQPLPDEFAQTAYNKLHPEVSKPDAPEAPEDVTPEVAPEDVAPETPEAPEAAPAVKPTFNEIWDTPQGQHITIDGEDFYKVGHSAHWFSPTTPGNTTHGEMMEKVEGADTVELGEIGTSNMPLERLQALGEGATLTSTKLGITTSKDSDGDWYVYNAGYHNDKAFVEHFPVEDWVITDKGAAPKAAPTHTSEDLMFMDGGTKLTIGEKVFIKTSKNDGEDWIEPQWGNLWTNDEIIQTMSESDDSPRFDTAEVEPNLTLTQLEGMKNGAEIYSEKLQTTLTKDSDNDWSSSEYSSGYLKDEQLLEMFHADDWEINSTGQVESNYSDYDLEGSSIYSELYSPEHDKNFTKMADGDWEDQQTGYTYDAEQLLSEYPDENFSLSQSEIDESYIYGQDISEFADLAPGSKINYTSHPTEEPTEYIKLDQDKWATIDYDGQPNLSGTSFGDGDFEDGYSHINHEAEEGEYTAPQLLEYEPNTPDMGKDDITPEWVNGLPVGTKLKASLSSKWTYEKTEEGWNTLNEYGQPSTTSKKASDDDMFKAASGKNDLLNIFIPESSEDSDSESPEETTPETPEAPEEVTPEAPASATETATLNSFSEESFKALPVGSTLTTGNESVYTKVGDNSWTATNGATFMDHDFVSLISYETAGNWKVESPEGFAPVETPEAPEAPVSSIKKLKDVSFAEFESSPVGTQVVSNGTDGNTEGTVIYTKIEGGKWNTGAGYGYNADAFTDFIKDHADNYSLKTPGADSAASPSTKKLEDVDFDEFKNTPIGSTVSHNGNSGVAGNVVYTKTGPDKWENIGGSPYTSSDFQNFIASSSSYNYDLVSPGSAPETAPAADTKLLSEYDYDDFKNLEVGTVITQTENVDIYTKINSMQWEVEDMDDLKIDNDAFEHLFNNSGGVAQAEKYVVTPVKWAPEKTLNDMDATDLINAPVGSTIKNKSGMVITKNAVGEWVSDGGMKFLVSDFVGYSNTGMGKDFEVKLGENSNAASAPSTSPVQKGVHPSKVDLDGYPVGTTLKQEMPAYVSKPSHTYYVKLDNGNWQEFKKTDKTLSAKNVMGSNALATHYGSFTASKPTSATNFITSLGEIGYVGDTVTGELGAKGIVMKVMKTGIKVQWHNGDKTTVKPSKVTMGDSSFGFKPNQQAPQATSTPSATPSPSVDATSSQGFAGFDPEDFNAKGLTMGHSENHIITTAYTLAPSHAPDTSNPLYGKPAPEEPATPQTYPSFVAPSNELPKWDSEEWLKKVEKRYADNPMKAKNTVQESNNWSAIQQVMNGEKIHLDKLLSSKYLDQDMYDEAIAGIDKQNDANQSLIEQHEKDVVAAKVKYDADKAEYLADYTAKKAAYEKEFADWSYANPNPDAMKPVYKPAASKENFMGGEVDWSKAHIGTHTAETVLNSIRSDNALARTGLSIATDSDKIENLNVKVNRIVSAQGDEVFDMRFKTTGSHGKTMREFFKVHGEKVGSKIYPPHTVIDPKNSGLIKDLGTPNKETYGDRYELTHEATGAKIIFQQDPNEQEFNMDTNHNSVRILMPLSSTPDEYQQVLDFIGITGKPASEGDIRVLAENRLITLFGDGKTAIGHGNLSGEARKKVLDKIKADFDITADDVEFVPEPNGKLRLHYKPEVTNKLAEKFDNIKNMYHSIYSGSASVDAWMNILTGPNAGLASTYFRWGNAIGYNGMSSGPDMGSGSGDYVYVNPQAHLSVGGNAIGIHPKAVLQRLDLWANYNDSWGKKGADGKNYGAMEKINKFGSSLAEIMPGESVHLNDMMYVSVDESYRKPILDRLKAKGILKINGIAIEDFVLKSGMKPPAVDYIPGIGVVPEGQTGIDGSVGAPAGGGPAV